ncbi:MAG: 4Fe-4S binding protein [Firmicutes bacterium]|nr:4Fe-4S binding protein [Bacillota bacterium]
MRELLVISGKGGTGKTSLVGAFAALAENKVLADCDVDAADLHLLLKPTVRETHEFYGSKKAVINQGECARCGRCVQACRFAAVIEHSIAQPIARCTIGHTNNDKSYEVNPIYCEGCSVCYHVCPQGAITMEDRLSGHWFISDTRYGPLVHARLGIAEENSGKLVMEVRKAARTMAEMNGAKYIITDGPPGIGCPVISSMSGADLALVVTEPTVSGKHDMERILELARYFNVKGVVCINKYDLDEKKSEEIEQCRDEGIEVVGRIPFDEEVVHALMKGVPMVDHAKYASKAVTQIWERLVEIIG